MIAEKTLLIEIGTEELPPTHLGKLSETFRDLIGKGFAELGISFKQPEHFATPRRLAVRFYDVPHQQEPRISIRRGPAVAAAYDANGQPTQAVMGFARSCNAKLEELKIQETPQGSWIFYEHLEHGKPIAALLPAIIENALNQLPAKKRMRWGSGDIEFLRPIHWITVVHGAKQVPITVLEIKASNTTRGHRVHHPQEITIDHADNYLNILREAKVIASIEERQDIIRKGITQLAERNNGVGVIDEALLDQVTGLVEWPVPLYAHFDRTFLDVPQEALISSMQNHQKCFPLKTTTGKLLPTFVLISNIESTNPETIIRGNERVMHARLADAKFFYDQDRKTPIYARLDKLKNMIFQKKLGSLYDKSQRISWLAGQIAQKIDSSVRFSERAGKLCKADLLTEMVFEFPELQGIMGTYYALNDKEPEEVAFAIHESYLPRFAKDILPISSTGICVALADRLDTLVGIFGIGQIPTGDKDPYALRRQALAILRILIEKELSLDLKSLLELAREGYGNLLDEDVIPKILEFCFDRFRAWHLEQGVTAQAIEAVLVNNSTQPFDASRRVFAVNHFQDLPEAHALANANKRVKNILQKSGVIVTGQQLPFVDPDLFNEEAEVNLAKAIETLKRQTDPLILHGKYQEALCAMAKLQAPVDSFFDAVLVMSDNDALRQNRINLLYHLRALFMQIADISKLVL